MELTEHNGGRASSFAQKAVLIFCLLGTAATALLFVSFAPYAASKRANVVVTDAAYVSSISSDGLSREAAARAKAASLEMTAGRCVVSSSDSGNGRFRLHCEGVARDRKKLDTTLASHSGNSMPEIVTETKVDSLYQIITLLFQSYLNEKVGH